MGLTAYAQETSALENFRREEDLIRAEGYTAEGYKFLNSGELEKALERFSAAFALMGNPTPATQKTYLNVQNGLGASHAKLAVIAHNEKRNQDAADHLAQALRYNPNDSTARGLASHIEKIKGQQASARPARAREVNTAMTPTFLKSQNSIETLFREGDAFFATGQNDKAIDSYRQILAIDRDNIAAANRLKNVYQKKIKSANALKDRLDAESAWTVRDKWSEDFRAPKGGNTLGLPGGVIKESEIERKLNSIQIEQLTLNEASLDAAISRLRQYSKTQTDAKGINIVKELGQGAPPSPITLELTNVTLREALGFVTKAAGVGYRVEAKAVIISPEGAQGLVTKIFYVAPDFIPVNVRGGGGGGIGPSSRVGGGGGIVVSGVKEALIEKGVLFDAPGSTATKLGPTKISVKNTPEELDKIESLVLSGENENQILVETKFVELTQNDLNELGFDWLVGAFGITTDNGSNEITIQGAATADGVNNLLTGGVRNSNGSGGRAGLATSSIDALLLGAGVAAASPNAIAALTGVITRPQFQLVIRALAQKKNVDLLSAPSVVGKNGKEAKIQITREFIYPTEFEKPQIPTGTGGNASSLPIVAPANPTGFVSRETGIILSVTPVVSANQRTISMTLVPEVVEFEGFVNYGSAIFAPTFDGGQGALITANVINQPIFSVRRVITEVNVYDGETVTLGGLIREDVQKVDDKVPILGDIPGLGRLFRNKLEQSIKRNLMIFVTANIIDPAGQKVDVASENVSHENQ